MSNNRKYRLKCFNKVFFSAPQLNPENSGVKYVRRYNKTKRSKGLL